mmetsp:Transcript_8420/g.13165  ORF Transcript_8420/g.13165 Transcript_8420/m.13165 type:complete len:218 (-) Transcript_8420:67-720(-)
MAISEISNALLITYIATEYIVSSQSSNEFSFKRFICSKANQIFLLGTFLINSLDTFIGAASLLKHFFEQLMHTPKVLMAALMYIIVLYADCIRHSPNLTRTRFLKKVAQQFLRIMPVYPFLAVLISFGFMLIVTVFENLRLPFDWLNWPIYYGTLYGPFSIVYLKVKKEICYEEWLFLPTVSPIQDHHCRDLQNEASKNSEEVNIRDLRMLRFSKKG